MKNEETKRYLEELHKLTDKQSKLFYMLNGKKDAYCYLVDDELYVIGVEQIMHRPVVKRCDIYSEELYEKLQQSFKCLRKRSTIESQKAFLQCYDKLNTYNRCLLSQYDILLLDFIKNIGEQKIQNMIDQVETYQLMYYFHIYQRGV